MAGLEDHQILKFRVIFSGFSDEVFLSSFAQVSSFPVSCSTLVEVGVGNF